MSAPLDAEPGSLSSTLERAEQAGIIDAAQANAILHLDAAHAPARGTRPRTSAVAAEVMGYVGGTLTVAAGAFVASRVWDQVLPGWRVTALMSVALLLLAAGLPLRRPQRPAGMRLGSFLWFASAAAFAFSVWEMSELARMDRADARVLTAWCAVAYTSLLWSMRRMAAQEVAAFLAIAGLVAATVTGSVAGDEPWVSYALWGLGVAWVLLAARAAIRPRLTGLIVGAVAALQAPLLTGSDPAGGELVLGVLTAVGVVSLSVALGQRVVLGLGVIGLLAYVPGLMFLWFGDTLGALVALLLAGVLLVGLSILVLRHRGPLRHAHTT